MPKASMSRHAAPQGELVRRGSLFDGLGLGSIVIDEACDSEPNRLNRPQKGQCSTGSTWLLLCGSIFGVVCYNPW